MTPLFDANVHPTLTTADGAESFSILKPLLQEAGFRGACAVGLPGKDGFDAAPYAQAARTHGFYPVAAWNDVPAEAIGEQLNSLVGLGYRAIKIHPRLSGLSVRDPRFAQLLRAAAEVGVVVFHCSYQFSKDARHPVDPLPALMDAVAGAGPLRMVLLHGGTVELLRYAEAIRPNHNVVLDLSFTLNRYAASSLDQDIAYLFRNFDQRICLGSDYPDYSPAQVRDRFEFFASDLPQEKRDNIAWRNITALLDVGPDQAWTT
jgi:predicted TIM-barrel fold metal-dependent hydrolase